MKRVLLPILAVVAMQPALVGAAPPSNDDRDQAAPVVTLPYLDYVSAEDASLEPDEPALCLDAGAPGVHQASVWYRFDAPSATRVRYVARLWEYYAVTWTIGGGISLAIFEDAPAADRMLACDKAPVTDREATIEMQVSARRSYFIQVSCACTPRPFTELEFTMAEVPLNDRFADATSIEPGFEDAVLMDWATLEEGEPAQCLRKAGPIIAAHGSVWYRISADQDDTLIATARRNHGGPGLGVFEIDGPNLVHLGCSGPGEITDEESPSGPNTDNTVARFDVQAGRSYLVQMIQNGRELGFYMETDFSLLSATRVDIGLSNLRVTPGPGSADFEFDYMAGDGFIPFGVGFHWQIDACTTGPLPACRAIRSAQFEFERIRYSPSGTVRVMFRTGPCLGEYEIRVHASDGVFNRDPDPSNDTAAATVMFTPVPAGMGAGLCGLEG